MTVLLVNSCSFKNDEGLVSNNLRAEYLTDSLTVNIEEADFECSNPMLNQLFAQTAIDSHDTSALYAKWGQRWPDARLIVPFRLFENYRDEFLEEDGIITGETQDAYAIALSFDLIPQSMRMQVCHKLVRAIEANDNKMSTDLFSTFCMLDELSKMGYHELACQLVEGTEPASWDETFGLVGAWMFKHILGISSDDKSPGWKHFYLEPKMGGTLTHAKGQYNSINGIIRMEWKLMKNILDLDFEIPANATATLIMPQGHLTEVHIDGEKLKSIHPDRQVMLKSGVHKVHMISR